MHLHHRGHLAAAWLLSLAVLLGQVGAASSVASAARPLVTFTDPAPDSIVPAGTTFRLGWKESAEPEAPIVGRSVATYAGPAPENGDCRSARTMLVSSTASAIPPRTYLVTGLAADTCYYWVVQVTDVTGRYTRALSGYVRRSAMAGGAHTDDGTNTDRRPAPAITPLFPALGATSDVPPPQGSLTISWAETSPAPVTDRTVVELAAPATGRDCAGAAWRISRVLLATSASLALDGLGDGTCYRYVVAIADADGRGATAMSGPLLVTASPPPCAYSELSALDQAPDEWQRTLLDPVYGVPATYVPDDLVPTRDITDTSGGVRIRRVAYADLKALAEAARAAGVPIQVTSAYRSYALQEATFDRYVKTLGVAGGLLRAARPGHSEHQLGTAIDVMASKGVSPSNYTDWTVTRAGAWMRDNAWRYGWLMSYPKAASPARTCYQYEPWHYRYVGRTVAKDVHDAGLSLREYLWRQGSLVPGA